MEKSTNKEIRYNPVHIESKWAELWDNTQAFKVDIQRASRPFYNLMMFPYPSGEGLHIGHTYTFGGADTFGRFRKMQGFDVFEPMGFDSFGIHSENFALKKNIHPIQLIEATTNYFRDKQLKRFGAIFDWDNTVTTSDPDYYRWTQWLFIELFKAGLAVRKKAKVEWCPSCLTMLANEQVIDGKCERCNSAVTQKDLEQWFFKITHYADRLLTNLDHIDWSATTKEMQRNWIGKSSGAEVVFQTQSGKELAVYTTRLDTIFGVSFLAIAPEHALLYKNDSKSIKELNNDIVIENQTSVAEYIAQARAKTDQDRMASKEKTGVFTGSYVVNPVNNDLIPVYVSDFVLSSYGTGAVMGVPAHDQRDYEFASKQDLSIKTVVVPKQNKTENKNSLEIDKNRKTYNQAFTDYGVLVDSGPFSGLSSEDAKKEIVAALSKKNLAQETVNYHLRDWLISRQRYWGPPIPMIYCAKCSSNKKSYFDKNEAKLNKNIDPMYGWFPVPTEELPVKLPYVSDFKPTGTGKSPLEQDEKFIQVRCPTCGADAQRETDVSDTFLDSSWYFLRYPNVEISKKTNISAKLPWDDAILKKWLPVDMYIGGNEHAVLHLLYTRFVTMVLHDLAYLNFEEPFKKFRANGLITYQGMKMSKSRGNVINPNDYFDSYGFDAIKLYLLFIGPFEEGGDWNDRGLIGTYRFLQRVWKLVHSDISDVSLDQQRTSEKMRTIKRITDSIEHLKFNTAIAALMEYTNFLHSLETVSREELETLILLLAPLAPYIAEESWQVMHAYEDFTKEHSVHNQPWPVFDSQLLVEDTVEIAIQVNGKFRGKVTLAASQKDDKEQVIALAASVEKVAGYLKSGTKKTIYVPGKLVNFIV